MLCLRVEHVGDVYRGIREVVALGENQASCFPNFQFLNVRLSRASAGSGFLFTAQMSER